jgi:ornithine carbamoyltransferase
VTSPLRHLRTLGDLAGPELTQILDVADELRAGRPVQRDLAGRSIGLVFEKPSTRTRVSFDVAVHRLGAHPVVLRGDELQLGRGETIEDTARILSGYLDAIVLRTSAHERVERLAAAASVPVVNALSDAAHPCQALADLQTIRAELGHLEGVRVAWVGDGNNMAHSTMRAAAATGLHLVLATPPDHRPDPELLASCADEAPSTGGSVTLVDAPADAVVGAQVVMTDVWASMGQEAEAAARAETFRGYQVDADLMARAAEGALFLHCLPAHRGQEVTAEVLDGPASRVWIQAENRLHTSQALLWNLLHRRTVWA